MNESASLRKLTAVEQIVVTVNLQAFILEVLGSNLDRDFVCPDRILKGVFQSPLAEDRIIPWTEIQLFTSRFFTVRHSSVVLHFNAE
jgi:hypothetical protein